MLWLVVIAVLFSVGHLFYKKTWENFAEIFLQYFLLFTVGFGGVLAAMAHIFMGPEIARQIGWAPGSPFQYEMGITNLSYGVLGITAYWIRGRFWDATLLGWSVLMIGCFIGHLLDYLLHNNTAPLNIGIYIWIYDLFLPILFLSLLIYLRAKGRNTNPTTQI